MDPEGDEKELHHGVNLAEAIKCGAVWYRVSRNQSDLKNTAIALDHLTRIAGSPSGAFIAGAWYVGRARQQLSDGRRWSFCR